MRFDGAGYRMMSPSHFFDTDIGGAAAGVAKIGLTHKGREWVREMEMRHMIVDLAHASSRTIDDVLAMATRPVVVSHTGVKGRATTIAISRDRLDGRRPGTMADWITGIRRPAGGTRRRL